MAYKPESYIHELDQKAFDALNLFPRFLKLQKAYITNVDEKMAKIEFLSSAIRLGEKQKPEVYSLLPPVCNKLGIKVPELYMVDSKEINAFTGGITEPFLCVTSELVKQLPIPMISSVLAHECGHIACGHYLYHSLAMNFANGIEASPLAKIPMIRKYLSGSLVAALCFWDRCSELTADRAAVLCDEDAGKTIDALMRVHGFDESINREEFLKQAQDLKAFINESTEHKTLQQMMERWNSHPMLATRAYECYDWAQTDRFRSILDGTFKTENEKEENIEEVITAEYRAEKREKESETISPELESEIDTRLRQLNAEIERYTVADVRELYAYAVGCGIVSGLLDAMFFRDTTVFKNDLGFSHRQVNTFIQEYAEARGFGRERLKDAIAELEAHFPVAQDNVWKGKDIKVNPKNHHLADLAHHPTPLGLISAIMVQFLRVGTFVNKNGEWHFVFVKTTWKDLMDIAVPAIITGVLNWLVSIAEEKVEETTGKEMPRAIHRLAHIVASAPILIEIAKCADNWFGHLVSDMGGSRNTAGHGMGIPGVFLSLLYEVSALPILKDTGLTEVLNDLYENRKLDLRHEMAHSKQLKLQAVPVLFNEISVRLGCMMLVLQDEIIKNQGIQGVRWRRVIPIANRTVDRMMAVASMTFSVIDTGDAAIRAAVESGGNWVVFSGRFVARYNYVGAGRAAVAVVKEFSNERKEAQLIHERMILMETKTQIMLAQLQEFEAKLEEKLTAYLAEDIQIFLEAFDEINEGLQANDSDRVIRGTVTIQRVLGREPQFTNQQEFDKLMESELPLQF